MQCLPFATSLLLLFLGLHLSDPSPKLALVPPSFLFLLLFLRHLLPSPMPFSQVLPKPHPPLSPPQLTTRLNRALRVGQLSGR